MVNLSKLEYRTVMSTLPEMFEFTLEQLSIGAFFTLPERADCRLVVGLLLIPIVYGLISNLALVYTVFKNKELRTNPSYYLLVHIACCDLVIIVFDIFYRLGGIIFRQAFLVSKYSPLNYTIPFFQQIAWWTFVFSLTLTAVNRFICIFFVGRYDTLFTHRAMLAAVGLTTVLGILMASPHLHPCCRVVWVFDEWHSSYWPYPTWYLDFDFVVTLTTIGIIVVSYIGVLFAVWQKQKAVTNGRRGRDQLRIALQVGLMCGIYILNSIMWNITPYIESSKWTNAAFTGTTPIQCAVHATIAFVFNSRVRAGLFTVMGKAPQGPRSSIATSSTTTSTVRSSNL